MIDFSPIQILIVLVIALIVFGPKRLPEMGRSIGRGIREFRGAIMDDGSAPPARSPEPARPAGHDRRRDGRRDSSSGVSPKACPPLNCLGS